MSSRWDYKSKTVLSSEYSDKIKEVVVPDLERRFECEIKPSFAVQLIADLGLKAFGNFINGDAPWLVVKKDKDPNRRHKFSLNERVKTSRGYEGIVIGITELIDGRFRYLIQSQEQTGAMLTAPETEYEDAIISVEPDIEVPDDPFRYITSTLEEFKIHANDKIVMQVEQETKHWSR